MRLHEKVVHRIAKREDSTSAAEDDNRYDIRMGIYDVCTI